MKRPILEIAAEILRVPAENMDFSMTPDDVDTWDSLSHLRLITAVEAEYGVRLSMSQITGMSCLRDLVAAVDPTQA